MINHTYTVTLTDVQQQLLSNDLYNDTVTKVWTNGYKVQ